MSETLATSIPQTEDDWYRHEITFKVSVPLLEAMAKQKHWLSLSMVNEDDWSPPVRFRFEKHEHDEHWDLVMQGVEAETAREAKA